MLPGSGGLPVPHRGVAPGGAGKARAWYLRKVRAGFANDRHVHAPKAVAARPNMDRVQCFEHCSLLGIKFIHSGPPPCGFTIFPCNSTASTSIPSPAALAKSA